MILAPPVPLLEKNTSDDFDTLGITFGETKTTDESDTPRITFEEMKTTDESDTPRITFWGNENN